MAVFRIEKTENYTVMSNYHLRDRELSCKACGLLSKMLSLPDEWDFTTRGLASICKDGVESIGTALKELEQRGYLVRQQLRDQNGRLSDVEYTIYEHPQGAESLPMDDSAEARRNYEKSEKLGTKNEDNPQISPCTEKPYPGNPYTVNPDTEKPDTGNPYTESPNTESPDTEKPDTENPAQLSTYKSSKEKESKDQSIYPDGSVDFPEEDGDLYSLYRERICENVDYDYLVGQYGEERVDGAVELILEAILTSGEKVRIGGAEFPRGLVRNRMLKLDSTHLEYVFDCMDKQTEKVRNIKGYLLKSLFNAPATIDEYYRAEVNHDFRSVAGKREE